MLPGKVTEKPFWLGQTSFLLTVKHVSPQTATSGAPQQGAEVRSWCAKGAADFLGRSSQLQRRSLTNKGSDAFGIPLVDPAMTGLAGS